MAHTQHMATLREYRFSRDPERAPAPKDVIDAEDIVTVEPRLGRGKVIDAIEKAQASSRGVGGAPHAKIRNDAGVVVDAMLKFGRHKGKTLSEIRDAEPSYLAWLLARPYDEATRPDGFPADFLDIVRRFA